MPGAQTFALSHRKTQIDVPLISHSKQRKMSVLLLQTRKLLFRQPGLDCQNTMLKFVAEPERNDHACNRNA